MADTDKVNKLVSSPIIIWWIWQVSIEKWNLQFKSHFYASEYTSFPRGRSHRTAKKYFTNQKILVLTIKNIHVLPICLW